MDKIIQIIKSIISPEQNWSAFAMKIIGLVVVTVIAYIAFQQYTSLTADEDNQNIPIIEVFEAQPEKKDEVEDLVNKLLRSDRDIQSVWLYDWVDARNVVPLMMLPRNSQDLLPTGYFMEGDEYVIGHFVLSQCTSLDRQISNTACPIMSSEDAWGILVVTYVDNVTNLKTTKATAMKISEILYLQNN